MLFYKRSPWWKHLKGIEMFPMDVSCKVSSGEGIETPYSTGSWRLLSISCFHSLLLPVWFIDLCILLLLMSPYVNPVLFVVDIHMKYTVEVVYILHGLWQQPISKKCCCVFAHHYILDDDAQYSMDYELSLLTKVFPHSNVCLHKCTVDCLPKQIHDRLGLGVIII